MSLNLANFNPYSHFYNACSAGDRLHLLRQNGRSPCHALSHAYSHASKWSDEIVRRLDRIDILGGTDSKGHTIGHEGCVNALAWSQSGDCLASGSDDTRVILWRMGSSDQFPSSIDVKKMENTPQLNMAQTDVIETGHQANIFSVKWAPNSSDRRLFTCAGDSEMRVFDLNRASSFTNERLSSQKEYRLWHQGQGACTHVLRCHSSRAKRISTENSPDVFLSCAEDGEVRQTDLRVPHTCSRSRAFGQGCPRPLVQFQMELYSLSVSKMEPWLFAVAGTNDKVFLLDRRMIPRLLRKEWGSELKEESENLTHCVRRFGRELPAQEEDEDEEALTRRRRRFQRAHVTAVKIAESNSRDILASYSGDGLYTFDMKKEPGEERKSSTIAVNHRPKASRSSTPEQIGRRPIKLNRIPLKSKESKKDNLLQHLFPQDPKNFASISVLQNDYEAVESLAKVEQREGTNDKSKENNEAALSLCRLLGALRRDEVACTNEEEHFDLEQAELSLYSAEKDLRENYADHAIGQEIGAILVEYMEAHHWKAISEMTKIRNSIFEKSKSLLQQFLFGHDDAQNDGEGQQHSSSQLAESRDTHIVTNINSDEGITSSPSNSTSEITTIGESSDESGEDDDFDEISDGHEEITLSSSDVLRAYSRQGFHEEEDDESDDDDDDDDEIYENMENSSEDEAMEDVHRHGLGGGDAPIIHPSKRFTGHVNVETVKDCGFLGSNDEYVWSGSDCGHLFIWRNNQSKELVSILKGDHSTVNVLAQHPVLPVCALSGIDDTIKLFGPLGSLPADEDNENSYNRYHFRDTILEKNAKSTDGTSTSMYSRGLIRLLSRHMMTSGYDENDSERIVVDGEEQECTIT